MRTVVRTSVVALAAVLVVPFGAPAHAELPTVASAKIVDTKCKEVSWRGTVTHKMSNGGYLYNQTKPVGASGTVKTCAYVYKVSDVNKKSDWYMVAVAQDWKRKSYGSEHFSGKTEPWGVRISSSQQSRDSDHKATATYKKPTFKSTLSVGLSWGIGSISVPVNLTSAVTVKRDYVTEWGARWSCTSATPLKSTAMVYGTKIKQLKKRPTFTVRVDYPDYVYKYKKVTVGSRGGPYQAWAIDGTKQTMKKFEIFI